MTEQTELQIRTQQVAEREAIIARYGRMIDDIDQNYPEDEDMANHRARLVKLIADETREMKMEILARDNL